MVQAFFMMFFKNSFMMLQRMENSFSVHLSFLYIDATID